MRNHAQVLAPGGPLAARRMAAHWVVLAAAALTALVAGHWPSGSGTGPDGAIPAALPASGLSTLSGFTTYGRWS